MQAPFGVDFLEKLADASSEEALQTQTNTTTINADPDSDTD